MVHHRRVEQPHIPRRANSRGPVRRKIKKGQLGSTDEVGPITDRSGASGVFNPPNNYNTIQPIEQRQKYLEDQAVTPISAGN